MIPSDHFVRFYNEVFKALETRGHAHLLAYWRELGRLQSRELTARFRADSVDVAVECALGLGADGEVLGPPDIAAAVLAGARAVVARADGRVDLPA